MVNVQLVIEYSKLFPDGNDTIPGLMSGIPKGLVLKAATSFLNADIRKKPWEEVLSDWFSEGNEDFINQMAQKISLEYVNKEKVPKILNPFASLKLLQIGLSLNEADQPNNKSKEQVEIDLFKIYALINESYTSLHTNSDEYLEIHYPELKIATLLITLSFSASELENYNPANESFAQFVKSFIYFNWAQDNQDLLEHNQIFLDEYQLGGFKDYYGKVVPFIQKISNKEVDGFIELVPEQNENYESNKSLLKKLSTQLYSPSDDVDFKVVRSHPLIQISEDTYRVSHPLFFIDKIYKSLFFEYSRINDTVENKINSFRTYYTTYFSEKVLLYKVMVYCFGNRYIQFNGSQLEAEGIQGAPDYYIRNGKYIFLFENKDIFINAQIKEQPLFEPLEAELKRKFLKEGTRPVGIGQLIKNIRRILSYKNKFDTNYKSEKVVIYPILVVQDIVFDCAGLNTLFNFWFNQELEKLKAEGLMVGNIKQLAVLRLDTLICSSELLKSNKLTLKELCDIYLDGIVIKKKKVRDYENLKKTLTIPQLPASKLIDNYLTQKFGGYLKSNKILKHFFSLLD